MKSDSETSQLVRRMRIFVGLSLTLAVLAMAALAASFAVKSPAQHLAEQAAPPPSVISTNLVRKILVKEVIARAKVDYSSSIDIKAPTTAGKDRIVVTGVLVNEGAKIEAGKPVLSISGRPMLVLHGSVPLYRDLTPGLAGEDVALIQKALSELNLLPAGYETKTFDPSTAEAVRALYKAAGFTGRTTADLDPQEADRLETLKSEVRTAERSVADAQSAGSESKAGELKSGSAGNSGPAGNSRIGAAKQDLDRARQRLNDATSKAGPVLPLNEVIMVNSFPATIVKVNATVGDTPQADGALVTLGCGELVATGVLPPGSQQGVKVGQQARLVVEETGAETGGKLVALGGLRTPGKDDKQPPGYPFTVASATPFAPDAYGKDARAAITVEASPDKVLVAPLSAIRSGPDGRSYINVLVDPGERAGAEGPSAAPRAGAQASGSPRQRQVPVKTGMSAAGEVEIAPLDGQHLSEQAKVVVS